MKFIVYGADKKIVMGGHCQESAFHKQANEGEFVLEGVANDITQKVEFDGFDENGQPINPRVVDKSSAEVEIDNPKTKPKSFKKRPARITNEKLEEILARIEALEAK